MTKEIIIKIDSEFIKNIFINLILFFMISFLSCFIIYAFVILPIDFVMDKKVCEKVCKNTLSENQIFDSAFSQDERFNLTFGSIFKCQCFYIEPCIIGYCLKHKDIKIK